MGGTLFPSGFSSAVFDFFFIHGFARPPMYESMFVQIRDIGFPLKYWLAGVVFLDANKISGGPSAVPSLAM